MVHQIGFKCNRGLVRPKNEDACFVIPGHDVYIVADGVGGNNSGEVASRIAVEKIAQYVNEKDIGKLTNTDDIFQFMTDAIGRANDVIYSMGRENPQYDGMATTIVMAYLCKGDAYIANIGDSRAYLFSKGLLKKITKDHTYVNELLDKGVITEEEAEKHRQKNVITKALGAEKFVEPDLYKLPLFSGDIITLCTDGLYGEVKNDILAAKLSESTNMNDTCSELVGLANKAGGRDNITVICVKV